MKIIPKIAFCLLVFSCLSGFLQSADSVDEKLFSPKTEEEFQSALTEASKAKVSPQVILEARFLYYVDHQDYDAIAAMSEEMHAMIDSFNPDDSRIFTLEEDWQAITHYALALTALKADKPKDFKEHITTAFWLSPRQASVFAPHIEHFKTAQSMRNVQLSFEKNCKNLLTGKPDKLLNKTSKANLLIFWSPWEIEDLDTLDDLKGLILVAHKHGIQVSLVLAEESPEIIADSIALIRKQKLESVAQWLRDDAKTTLARTLKIQSAPTVVLVDAKGKIAFNGHPAAKEFWDNLQKIVPEIVRPQRHDHSH